MMIAKYVCIVAKMPLIWSRLSVRLCQFIPFGRISVKFYIGEFCMKICYEISKGLNCAAVSHVLHEHLNKFYCCRWESIAIKGLIFI